MLVTISRLGSTKQSTLIGSTNLNTAHLDIYEYHKLNNEQQIDLLMATSAIPVVFPPVKFNNYLYVDGGEMFNEIITDHKRVVFKGVDNSCAAPAANLTIEFNLS